MCSVDIGLIELTHLTRAFIFFSRILLESALPLNHNANYEKESSGLNWGDQTFKITVL